MFNKLFQAIVITLILGWIGGKGMVTTTTPIATVNSPHLSGQMIGWNLLDPAL
jgi:hypothetical protein